MTSAAAQRRSLSWVAAALALIALLPFARGLLQGRSLFFRDLSAQFFPLRRFVLQGLRDGELRAWNPYTHEGEPLALPALGYPLDLLQLLRPDELGMSWSLALHVAFAAVAFLAFARERGLPLAAAACGALVYALGGFALSSVNLYVYVQALAWAPLVVLGLRRSAAGGRPQVAYAALATGVCLSTTGAEVAAQALLIGLLLAAKSTRAAWLRLAAVVALGTALAAFALLPLGRLARDSARGAGFHTDVVLAHSVHPLTLVQTFVAGFYGDPANLTGRWWGVNFFPRGFPYWLSLYLGGGAICLALLGLGSRRPGRTAFAGLAALGILVCLGKYAGLAAVVDLLPGLHAFRYPTKAFFTVHFAAAALAAFGLAELIERGAPLWRRFAAFAFVFGAALASVPLWPRLLPGATRDFLAGFCPPQFSWPLRTAIADHIAADAATGGLVLLCLAGVAMLVAAGRLRPLVGATAVSALIAADLLRAGAGLNPSVTRSYYELSPESANFVTALRSESGRAFSCDTSSSPSYVAARLQRGVEHEALTFAALQETLAPDFNVRHGVRTALSIDRTMLVPEARVTSPDEASCRDMRSLVPRLRAAGVSHVLSLDPLADEALLAGAVLEPARIAPLRIHVYRLREPLPQLELAGTSGRARLLSERPGALDIEVDVERAGRLVVREAFAPGWSAEAEGRRLELRASRSGHCSVEMRAGTTRIRLRYRPPGLRLGALVSGASGLICIALLRPRPKPALEA